MSGIRGKTSKVPKEEQINLYILYKKDLLIENKLKASNDSIYEILAKKMRYQMTQKAIRLSIKSMSQLIFGYEIESERVFDGDSGEDSDEDWVQDNQSTEFDTFSEKFIYPLQDNEFQGSKINRRNRVINQAPKCWSNLLSRIIWDASDMMVSR